jgi:hypothetical protein
MFNTTALLAVYSTYFVMHIKVVFVSSEVLTNSQIQNKYGYPQKTLESLNNFISRFCVILMCAQGTIRVDSQAERQKGRHYTESYRGKSDKQLQQERTDGCFVIADSSTQVDRFWQHLCSPTPTVLHWQFAYPRESILNGHGKMFCKL